LADARKVHGRHVGGHQDVVTLDAHSVASLLLTDIASRSNSNRI
jgi:hypothetical protein